MINNEIKLQFKEFFKEYKKFLLLPLMVIPVGLYIYFAFVDNNQNQNKQKIEKGINTSTPVASVSSLENNKGYHYDLVKEDSINKVNMVNKDQGIDLNLNKKSQNNTKGFYDNEEDVLNNLNRLDQDLNSKGSSNSSKTVTNNNNDDKLINEIRALKQQIAKNNDNVQSQNSKTIESKKEEEELEEEEDGVILGWSAPELKAGYSNSTDTESNSKSGNSTSGLIKAIVDGTRLRNNMVTKENPRVKIRVIEPFFVNGREIPKNKYLIAYAKFSNELFLKINRINLNDGSDVIQCDIDVLDYYGQPALEVMGGTGASIENDVSSDIADDLSNNETVQKVPGGSSVIKSIFKKKVKAKVNSDYVYLKIN